MENLLDSLFKPWTRIAETGLLLMGSAMQAAGSAVGVLAGEQTDNLITEPPLNGPRSMNEATADFASRLVIIARSASSGAGNMGDSLEQVLGAARKSFGGIGQNGFRQWMALPLQLPLSFGALMAQSGVRGLHAGYISGLSNLPGLLDYTVEFFTDLDIFVTLQYKDYLAQLVEQVRQSPEDARKRMLLGRTYTKLGCYEEAIQELAEAAKDEGFRPAALQESAVAHYRSGQFSQAIADGTAALDLDPSDDRARFWLLLAAQKLGGYPDSVPESQRIEIKVGRHPSKLQFEEIASKIGLDKTSGGRGTAVFDMDGDGYLDAIITSVHAG